jgi:spore germination protein
MKSLKYILVLVLGVAVGFSAGYLVYQESESDQTGQETHYDYIDYSLDKDVSVYLPWWDQDRAFEDVKSQAGSIKYINTFWYEAKEDGSTEKYTGAEDEEIKKYTRETGVALVPVINNDQSAEKLERILSDETTRDLHIENIVKLVSDNDYQGIEVDYESLEAGQEDGFSIFIRELAAKLHQDNKILATAVHAKTSDKGTWEGPEAQDWKVLGEVCDQVKIMAYDYHWSTSEAGDIAPLSWIKKVLDYSAQVLPKEKTYLGLNFYGYDWVGEKGADLLYEDVTRLIDKYNPSISMSEEGEKTFIYNKDDVDHTVYFADSETVAKRLPLINEYGLAGIGIWRIGGEDGSNWNEISKGL